MITELSNEQILKRADKDMGNGFVFGVVGKSEPNKEYLFRHFTIIRIRIEKEKGIDTYYITLQNGFYMVDKDEHTVHLGNMSHGLLTVGNLKDAQNITTAILNSDILY
jgi:hypothetical protein